MLQTLTRYVFLPTIKLLPPVYVGALILSAALSSAYEKVASCELSTLLRLQFLVSILLMVIHKVECYYTQEYDKDPVYLWFLSKPSFQHSGQVAFLTMCFFVTLMLSMIFLILLGGSWPITVLGIWCMMFVHETHHIAKSIRMRHYYSGLFTSILFSGFGLFFFVPHYWEHFAMASSWQTGLWLFFLAWGLLHLVTNILEEPVHAPKLSHTASITEKP